MAVTTKKTYLINLETLKNDYTFDDNISDKYVKPNIIKCQDFIIRPLLGEIKWAEIILEIENKNISTLNDELIKDYLQPIIAYYVMSEVVYATAYKLKNEGVDGVDEKSFASRFNELVRISKKYLIDSEQYQSRLKQWMRLYTPLVPDALYKYKCPIYLGGAFTIDYDNLPDKNL